MSFPLANIPAMEITKGTFKSSGICKLNEPSLIQPLPPFTVGKILLGPRATTIKSIKLPTRKVNLKRGPLTLLLNKPPNFLEHIRIKITRESPKIIDCLKALSITLALSNLDIELIKLREPIITKMKKKEMILFLLLFFFSFLFSSSFSFIIL